MSTELARLSGQVRQKAQLSATALLDTMTAVALGDVRGLYEKDEFGRSVLKNILALTEAEQTLIVGVKHVDGGTELKIERTGCEPGSS